MKTQQDIQQMIYDNDFDLDIINTHIRGMQYHTTVSISFGDNHSCKLQVVDDYKMVETNISNGGQDSSEVMVSFVKCLPQTAYVSDGEVIDGLCDFDGWNQLFTEEMLEPINQVLFDIALREEGVE